MKSIFFKIYGSVIIVALLLTLTAYFLLGAINKTRFENYFIENVGGTFSLMAAGISRHKQQKRQQWIDVVERLTGITLEIHNVDNLKGFTQYTLKNKQQAIYIKSDASSQSAEIGLPISPQGHDFVFAKISNIDQTIGRVTALLILNELGRHPKPQRPKVLKQLDDNFSFALTLLDKTGIELDKSQWRQLLRGDIITHISDTVSGQPVINIYAKYGNSGQYLGLGPIKTFHWYPMSIVLPLAMLAALVLLLVAYFILAPLEKRLRQLEHGISLIGTPQAQAIEISGRDGIASMAGSINDMAQRIDLLVGQQRQLTNDISHELRTPIARMMFRIEYLSGKVPSNDDVHISGIKSDLNSLSQMVDEMLNNAKLEQQQTLNRASFDLKQAIQSLVTDAQIQYPALNIIYTVDHPSLMVEADQTLLLRAISNLLHNACRYTKHTVAISLNPLKASADNHHIEIQIEDDGPGIPTDQRQQIFSPFVRIDESRNRASGGFGLGLSIVQKIITLHQGEVKAGSSPTLAGAMFTVNL